MQGLAATYSSAAVAAVPSALRVFTAEFGMGSGVWPLAVTTRPVPGWGAAGLRARACPARAGEGGAGCGVCGEAGCVACLRGAGVCRRRAPGLGIGLALAAGGGGKFHSSD